MAGLSLSVTPAASDSPRSTQTSALRRERSPRRQQSATSTQAGRTTKSPGLAASPRLSASPRLASRKAVRDEIEDPADKLTTHIAKPEAGREVVVNVSTEPAGTKAEKLTETRAEKNEVERKNSVTGTSVTTTKTINIQPTRHVDVTNDVAAAESSKNKTATFSIEVSDSRRVNSEKQTTSAGDVTASLKPTDELPTKVDQSRSVTSSKLSSVRNKFEAGMTDSAVAEKAKPSYGDLKKAGIRSGKLASLSQRFAAFEQQETAGPILPKPPPQPGTNFVRGKTQQSTVTLQVSKPTTESVATETAASRRDIPEISISSELELNIKLPTDKPLHEGKQSAREDSTSAKQEVSPITEAQELAVEADEEVTEDAEPVSTATDVSAKTSDVHSEHRLSKSKQTATKSLDIPSKGLSSQRSASKERVSKVGSLDVPSSGTQRATSKERLSQSPARNRSPAPPKDVTPRRDVNKLSSIRRDVKAASPARSPARSKLEKSSPPSRATKGNGSECL